MLYVSSRLCCKFVVLITATFIFTAMDNVYGTSGTNDALRLLSFAEAAKIADRVIDDGAGNVYFCFRNPSAASDEDTGDIWGFMKMTTTDNVTDRYYPDGYLTYAYALADYETLTYKRRKFKF